MTRFAPVAPVSVLQAMKRHGVLGDYHLLLAHDVVAHPKEYISLFDTSRDTLIMDNSLIELGHPADRDTMVNALQITGAQYVVLPDYLKDGEATLNASFEAIENWGNLGNTKLIGVMQGSSKGEVWNCCDTFLEHLAIKGIFVPRILVEQFGSRRVFVEYLNYHVRRPDLLVHLLGFSDDPADDISCAKLCNGIDSAVPIRMGQQDRAIWELFSQIAGPRGDYWNSTDINKMVLYNLDWIRKAISFNAQATVSASKSE